MQTSQVHGQADSIIGGPLTAPEKPSSTVAELSTEQKLVETMDRLMTKKLEAIMKEPADGEVPLTETHENQTIRLVMEWMKTKKRVAPDGSEGAALSVENMKQLINQARRPAGRPLGSKNRPRDEGEELAKALGKK
jgi:hypothetical protein